MPGSGWNAASEATLRIAPAPRSTIRGRNAPVRWCTAATLSRTMLLLALGVGARRTRAERAEAGVVAQAGDVTLAGLEPLDERRRARPASVEVARLDGGVDAVRRAAARRELARAGRARRATSTRP